MSNDGGPAFPMTQHFDQHDNEMPAGMSLRGYFAAAIAPRLAPDYPPPDYPPPDGGYMTKAYWDNVAYECVAFADALIAALAERGRDE